MKNSEVDWIFSIKVFLIIFKFADLELLFEGYVQKIGLIISLMINQMNSKE